MSNGSKKDNYIAWLLGHEYGFAPYDPLKYERVLPTDNVGSHFFANTSNIVKCHIQYDTWANSITGTLVPNVTGVYPPVDWHNDKNYFRRTDEAWFIWWDGVDTWNISEVLGVQGDAYWIRTSPAIEGEYVPQGTAAGTPTVEPPNL